MAGSNAMSILVGVEFRIYCKSASSLDSELHAYKNTHGLITNHNQICKVNKC